MARYALVVGISQYCSPLKSLEKTATDAEAVAQVLEEYGDFVEVKRLPSRRNPQTQKREMVAKAVTGAELGQALQTLLLEQACQNEALIYFTGHGITVPGNLGQPRGYLATSDCEIEAEGQQIINQKHGIAFDDLNDLISKSELSSLVVLLDCCHSGHFLERNLIERTFRTFSTQKDYYLITAGRSFQPVYARRNEPHSVFTGALLQGLAAENADSERRVSGDRLFDHISRELRGSEQEPLRLGWGKSLTLVTHPPLVVPPTADVPGTTAVNRENPYLGLRAFDSGQADYFFGRILAVRALLDRLNSSRFLGVIGSSGCGKSSLVKAGLLPALKCNYIPGSSQWIVESFTPGTRPLESLQKALERQRQNQPLVVFIDQFEEVFTLCEDETERREFICRITQEATNSDRLTRVIVAMRGDFLDRCAAYQEAAVLINRTQPTTYFVTPFTLPELEEVIEKPAEKHGVTLERGLVPQIIADVMNQPGGLPLLQYALAELWRVCITESPPNSQLTCKGYEQIRGVKGALEKRANDLYQNLAPADKVFVRRLFLALVQLGEAKEVTRRRATWQELEVSADSQEQLIRVTRQLASQEQRLIITDEKTVEVAHEALLLEWGQLKEWIEQDRENLRLSRRLEAECKEWQRNDCSDGLLLTDAWLAAIADWVKKTQPRLSPLEQEFLGKSLEKRDQKKQAELDQERQLRKAAEAKARFTLAAGILATLTFGFGFVAKLQEERAIRGEAFAAGALVSNAVNLYESQNQLDSLIESIKALTALGKIGEATPEQIKELQSVIYKIQERNRVKHDSKVYGISFGDSGETFVSAGDNKIIKLWSLEGKLLDTSSIQQDKIYDVRFGTDGKLASASFDGTVKIWKVEQNKLIDTQLSTKVSESAYGIAFNPKNSNILAISDAKGMVKIWDTNKTGMNIVEEIDARKYIKKENLKNLKGYGVYSLDFSPDGEIIAYGYEEGGVYIWNWKTGKPPRLIGEHKTVINKVRFSPDGLTLASASHDGTIQLWNAEKNYALKGQIKAYEKYILGLAFSHNSQKLASSSLNEPIKVWDLRQTEERYKIGQPFLSNDPMTIAGYNLSVRQIEFHPKNQNLILSASDDTTARLWDWNYNNSNDKASQDSETLLRDSCKAVWDYAKTNSNLKEVKDTCYKYNNSM
ncbi:caspase family protein [Microcoleus sp. FACHB-SPT15]|uniref:nSTAND1 domain-containing NTPase n=1 Tax=Microcoleus sp. FACHB-SPT15 TaxID=2692830 RepID=UPI0017842BE0|nr:caspase family protein [Microcoleus sp. FACHB-SPT15]MBD1807730.1 caspase family protein [Microcoleus sp. FACHB-SPT15]